MEYTMRWYGPNDGVTLKDIAQAGCTGVVTALHQIPVGEIWTDEAIKERKKMIKAEGLKWSVVESLPVHEDIKKRNGNYQQWIENYKISLQNLSSNGIYVITYNFMPVLDWLRTNLNYETRTGFALRFEWLPFVAFDLFILQRPDAEKDYSESDIAKAKNYFDNLSAEQKENLAKACMQGLPGSKEAFSKEKILSLLDEYKGIDEATLQQNLFLFLNEISTVAEAANMQMAIHPDDPPFPVLGLPRIMSHANHVRKMIENVPSKIAGLCFCTGSYGARKENNLQAMFQEFSSRIYFLHLRSTQRDNEGNFFEADHLAGDADLFSIVKLATELERSENKIIPMRPDHGHQLNIDNDIDSYPGYSFVGRLKGLAEIKGMETAIKRLSNY
ncbi:mannonate dehydratase [Arachidicoccus ginsenosidimutans]|uniref:mannonate dehydratase n=1 Tax=Arachidicoccus sp. BS20 TaxID=1850526 RepID=UPI0007F12782|nr:mannonate dehydratase [Arachidicoccus sp. BS20]ANI88388.1 mannonate dehydratase [Arachidicoccus sp. BS20]